MLGAHQFTASYLVECRLIRDLLFVNIGPMPE